MNLQCVTGSLCTQKSGTVCLRLELVGGGDGYGHVEAVQ